MSSGIDFYDRLRKIVNEMANVGISRNAARKQLDIFFLEWALDIKSGNISQAAKLMDTTHGCEAHRNTMSREIKRNGIDVRRFKRGKR